ncbi:MAG TPA: hypothetical protein VFL29_11160 [Candidatus Dormibacteraeota bacterium]|nr:hypothetical protein [Candidatus Dormibacteraeota bacterium]
MSRPPERPLARWYLVTLGVLWAVILVVMVIVAFVSPTQEVLTGLAGIVIPAVLVGGAAAVRYLRGRR